jgi:neutral ceramidase
MRIANWARVAVLAVVVPGVTLFAQTFKAGAGQADIQTSAGMFPFAEFTGQHDPASCRVLLLDDGSQQIVILTVDTPSIQDPSIVGWKAILTRLTGVNAENSLVIATHTTPAPHVSSGEGRGGGGRGTSPSAAEMAHTKAYAQAVDDAIATAAKKAVANLQPAQVGFGLGTSRVSVNRDVLTAKGWGVGYNDAGFTDPSLAVIRINSLDGRPLAWVMDYAVRPAVMEQSTSEKGGSLISADIVGASRHFLESQYGSGATAIFLMGAGVDQSPLFMANRFVVDKDGNTSRIDIHEAGYSLVDLLGERLGSEAVRVSEGIKTAAVPVRLRLVRQRVEVSSQVRAQPRGADPLANSQAGQKVEVPIIVLQIGDIALVGVVPELNASMGVKIKSESPFPHTVVVTMVDGSAKYLPDTTNYERNTPEALGSQYARGSAEAVVAEIEAQLKQLHDATDRSKPR